MDTVRSGSALPLLWVVTDQLPYPPRNGITLPVFNYLKGLGETHRIRLILLVAGATSVQDVSLTANEELFGPVTVVPLTRKPKLARVFGELSCREMFQHGWESKGAPLAFDPQPDAILVSPMSAVAKWRALHKVDVPLDIVQVAAVNDCTTAEYYYRGQTQIGHWKHLLKSRLDRIRSGLIGRIERKLLQPYRTVFLQTARDRELMAVLVGADVAQKVVIAPNGVAKKYSEVVSRDRQNVVFVGELSGEYGDIVYWLVNEVWPAVLNIDNEAVLQIVGRGASDELKTKIANTVRVQHVEYVDDLASVYAEAMVAICPVFKGFGLINKTLEAMACGVPVVGGIAAFNGIPGFQANVHGAVCATRTTKDFVATLSSLLNEPSMRKQIGSAGRQLVAGRFSWDATTELIDRALSRNGSS